ncbi:unnamed protein product [Allacma fusca]|uniref:Uncharacterized protein n=1 Tax=Allacma fusca TaxID=39272 RepID=A0A8J2NIM3_9HEXA|nr:unnamed protein product [Allacma fusca]
MSLSKLGGVNLEIVGYNTAGGFVLLCGEDNTTAACGQASKAKIEVKPPPSKTRLTVPDKFRLQTHKQESRVRIEASTKITRGTQLGTLDAIR